LGIIINKFVALQGFSFTGKDIVTVTVKTACRRIQGDKTVFAGFVTCQADGLQD
jgi:hypothetical protein